MDSIITFTKSAIGLSLLPMKYTNYIGALAAIALIAICFVPWVYIETLHREITGMRATGTNYGKPGLMNILLSSVSVILFIIPAVWSKRLNLFICSLNVAWSVRNYLVVSQCELGECPEKRWGLYALVLLSIIIMGASLFPKVELKDSK
ncbi:MAG: hypothetical protein JWQ96_451 [Segetibacter sp.]|jgi:hypothetical protein|nr:hypothetical protein [Segetibacter sp.]